MTDAPAPAAPTPRRKRRWLRRLGLLFVLLLAIGAAAPMALSIGPVRRFVAEKVSERLGRRLTIGGITAAWWSGIELRDVEVHNPDGWDGDPLFSVDRVKVEVALGKAIGGHVEATVWVDRPVLTYQRRPDGTSNADGLFEGAEEKQEPSKGQRPTVTLHLKDGRVVAHALPEKGQTAAAPEVVDGITLEVAMRADGAVSLSASALARGAKAGGGDVPILAKADLDAKGAGPASLSAPSLDLGRLSTLVSSATGLEHVAGTLDTDGKLVFTDGSSASGTVRATITNLSAQQGKGTVALASAELTITPTVTEGADAFDLALVLRGLSATGFSDKDRGLSEPELSVRGKVVRQRNGDLAFGDASAPVRIAGRVVSGTLSGSMTGMTGDHAEADLSGRLALVLSPTLGRLAGLLAEPDAELSGTITLDASAKGRGGVLDLVVDGTIADLRVGGDAKTAPYEEPKVGLGLTGRWDGAARSLTLTRATLAARALRVGAGSPQAPFVVRAGNAAKDGTPGSPSAEGQIAAVLDLGRLGGLESRLPFVSSLRGGTVRIDARATAGQGLSVAWKVEGTDLAFAPGALSTAGFTERHLLADGTYARPEKGDGSVTLSSFTSSLVALVPGAAPVRVRLGTDGATLEGKARFSADLTAIGRALDKGVGLKPGETLGGTLDLAVDGSSRGPVSEFDLTLSSRDLRLPGTPGPSPLEGSAHVAMDAGARTTDLARGILKGYGLDVKASASLGPVGDATGMRTASFSATGDLAEARPLLGLGLALAPDAVLSGRLDSRAEIRASGKGRTLTGKTTIERLRYVPGRAPATPGKPGAPAAPPRAPTPIEEASIVVEHTLSLGVVADTTGFDRVSLRSGIANATVTGTMRTRDTGTKDKPEEETDVDLKLEVDGDATRIADTLRNLFGEGYEDMAGDGRVKGQFVLVGPTGNDGRDLRIDGDLAWRRFASGGISSEDGTVALRRPAPGTPLLATAKSKVNGGTFDLQASCDLGKGKSPWTAKAKVVGLDTSPMVTGKGASRYLPLLLPAIVPAGSASPVLSGKLDADLDLRSDALRETGLSDTLSGPGSIKMTQGSVSDSTLFSALSGQAGGGSGLGMLAKVVPALGGSLGQLGKAVMFSELSSTFRLGARKITLDPVVLVSPSVSLRFQGVVGFDGSMDLTIPLVLGGEVGAQVGKYVPDRTIPLRVRGKTGALSVTPDLKLESLGKGLLEGAGKGLLPGGSGKGKGLLDGLEGLLPGGMK